MQNTVSFKVAGAELSAYIDQIQKKSDALSNSAIKGAIDQVAKGKEVLKIIDDQIKAVERKSRMETQAARSILQDKRDFLLNENRKKSEDLREGVINDPKLSDKSKDEKILAINANEKDQSDRIKNDYRENLNVVKETDRQAKIQTSLAKENLDALKSTAKENVKAITSGDLKLADVIKNASTDEEKLIAKLTEEGVKQEKKLQDKEGGSGKSVFTGMMAVDNINKMLSAAGQFSSTNNGFDLIQPASNMAGRVIGGIIGGLIGALAGGVGAVGGAALGASIGGGFGDVIGAFEQKRALGKEEFYKTRNRYNAITGLNNDNNEIFDTEKAGISATDNLKLQVELARKQGTANGSSKTTRDVIYADRGYGVDQNTSGILIEMMRSSKEGNKDLAMLIGNVLQKGQGSIFRNGDHTFLNEFLSKFAVLQKELLKTQTNVATGTTMDILTRFNKLGGEWDAKDPRSQGNINAIQNSLSNPGTDNLKALSFGVLRKMMPNASIFDILKERQKGIASPGYLKGMLEAVDGFGGDDSSKQVNLASMFPGLSNSAVSKLYQNRSALTSGSISIEDLKSKYKDDFQSKSEDNTSNIERTTAEIQNGILKDRFGSIEAMADAFVTAVESTMSGAVIQLNDNRGTITFPGKGVIIKQNETKKAYDASDAGQQEMFNSMRDTKAW